MRESDVGLLGVTFYVLEIPERNLGLKQEI
jgi:hypothetical protein